MGNGIEVIGEIVVVYSCGNCVYEFCFLSGFLIDLFG